MHSRYLGALLTGVAVACHGGPRPLRLGTTYTVQQSGALAVAALRPPDAVILELALPQRRGRRSQRSTQAPTTM